MIICIRDVDIWGTSAGKLFLEFLWTKLKGRHRFSVMALDLGWYTRLLVLPFLNILFYCIWFMLVTEEKVIRVNLIPHVTFSI